MEYNISGGNRDGRFCPRVLLSRMGGQLGHAEKKSYQVEEIYWFYWFEKVVAQGLFSCPKHRSARKCHYQHKLLRFMNAYLGHDQIKMVRED